MQEGCSPPFGVNFVGPVEYPHGVGVSARAYAALLARTGVRLNVVPWRIGFERLSPVPVDYPAGALEPLNLIHLNLDLLSERRLLDSAPLDRIATSDRYNVAIVYWELASLPPQWVEVIHRFDEIWCASSFIARAVAAVSARPTRVVRPALDVGTVSDGRSRADLGLPSERFVFLYCADAGSILARKNPRALIAAYLEEFRPEDRACCVVKINPLDPHAADLAELRALAAGRADVMVLERPLDNGELGDLYRLADCYVSPHRSEGLGLTVLEAMRAGKPVIATPYGGVTDFVDARTAVPLDYRLVEVGHGNLPYAPYAVWADPLASSLRVAMRRLRGDPLLAARVGAAGRSRVSTMFAPGRAASVLVGEIERIWGGGGLHRAQDGAVRRVAPPLHASRGVLGRGIAAAGHAAKALVRRVLPPPTRALVRRMVPARATTGVLRISMLMPVDDLEPDVLDGVVSSLLAQSGGEWELCICDNGSTSAATLAALERQRGCDPRIRIVRSPTTLAPAAAAAQAVEFATGRFVGLPAHGWRFEVGMIRTLVRTISLRPDTDVYCIDRDDAAEGGCAPDPGPTWSADRLRSQMFVRPLMVMRKSVLLALEPEGAQAAKALLVQRLPIPRPGSGNRGRGQ